MITDINTILTKTFFDEVGKLSLENQTFLNDKVRKVTFPDGETGVGWFAVSCTGLNFFQRNLYRISPGLTQILRKKKTEEIASSSDLLQEIAKVVISVCIPVFCYSNIFTSPGMTKIYTVFWQDMLDSGEAKEYPFVKDVITAPYKVAGKEEFTETTVYLQGDNPELEITKIKNLYSKFKEETDKNLELINSLCSKCLKQSGENRILEVADNNPTIQEIRDRLMDRQLGMKIFINTFVQDNCPIIYAVFKNIFAEQLS